LKSSSSNIGGRHCLHTKRVIGSESSPNADVTIVSNRCSEHVIKQWWTFEKGLLWTIFGLLLKKSQVPYNVYACDNYECFFLFFVMAQCVLCLQDVPSKKKKTSVKCHCFVCNVF
ncbi:unnamed protein product, partial [Ixodes pacificus]